MEEEVKAEALTEAEPGSPSPGAEEVGGAALSEDDDAPKQRSVVPTSGTHAPRLRTTK